jgi:tetratricopeptide (TPR) repeat protein
LPPDPAELIERAVAALKRGAWDEAATLARAVLERVGPEANALMVLAGVATHAADLPQAIELYERARALMPRHIHVLVNLAAAYRAVGRTREACDTLREALQVDPQFAIAHNNLGNVLTDLGEREEARRSFERASALEPQYPDPLASLARMAEEEHRLEEAQGLAERALRLAPQNDLARLTCARVCLRRGNASEAVRLLEVQLRSTTLSVTNRVLAQGYLGDAYDRLARYGEALAAFTRANELQHSQYASTFAHEAGALAPKSIARLTRFLEGAEVASWSAAPPCTAAPVFMVGFPRSGTTLLEQILASHPQIETLEERDTLTDAVRELINAEAALQGWSTLGAGAIERLRRLYWQRIEAGLSRPPRALFIDKQPLNAVLLPLIYRLFPQAKIILAIRDPRDAVLSCYQQRFNMNIAMYQLLRLQTATAYYDAVMQLVQVSRARLPLSVHVVKYEDVVEHFDATVQAVLTFLGLEWDEAVRRYTSTARGRVVNTPSASQVVRPLYASSRGRWRHYAALLEPHVATLSGWAEVLGYEAS